MRNTFEGGTHDSPITLANSGGASGDAFGFIITQGANAGTGSANAKYVNNWAQRDGNMSLLLTLGASSSYVGWAESVVADRYVIEFPLYFTALPSAAVVLGTIRNASGIMAEARLATTGRIQGYAVSTAVTNALSSVLSINTKYIVQLAVTRETGAGGNGLVELRVLDSARAVVYTSTAAATSATGTAAAAQYRIGGATTASGWTTLNLDSVQAMPLASGWPAVIGTPPTVVLTGAQRYVVDARGSSDPDGTPAYACTDAAGLAFTEPIDGLFLFTQDATSHTVTISVTQGTDALTQTHVVPAVTSTPTDSIRHRYWNGTVLA